MMADAKGRSAAGGAAPFAILFDAASYVVSAVASYRIRPWLDEMLE
jgi:hypothetical protein